MERTAFISGSAGFIGYFTAHALLAAGWRVVGFDALSDDYDVGLKQRRHAMLGHSYAHLYGLPVTVFRFFTVYGPLGAA